MDGIGHAQDGSQQRIGNYVSECEKLLAESDSLHFAFRKYCADLHIKISRLQTTLGNEMKSADGEGRERKRLFSSEKDVRAQLRHGVVDREELVDLQNKLDDSMAKKRRAQNSVMSLQSQRSWVRSVFKGYLQRSLE